MYTYITQTHKHGLHLPCPRPARAPAPPRPPPGPCPPPRLILFCGGVQGEGVKGLTEQARGGSCNGSSGWVYERETCRHALGSSRRMVTVSRSCFVVGWVFVFGKDGGGQEVVGSATRIAQTSLLPPPQTQTHVYTQSTPHTSSHLYTQHSYTRTHPQVALLDLQPVVPLPLQLPPLPLLRHAHLTFCAGGLRFESPMCTCMRGKHPPTDIQMPTPFRL